MGMEIFLKVREMGKAVKEKRKAEEVLSIIMANGPYNAS